MAKPPKRASPRPGRNGGGPTMDEINEALAIEILDQENSKMLREVRKRHRASFEGLGGNLGHLDELYRRRDDTAEDLQDYFTGLFKTFGAHFEAFAQMDFFVRKTTSTEKATFEHKGRMSGLKGEPPEPPPNLVGQEIQDWEKGYRAGAAARVKGKQTFADTMAQALANADAGLVTDGKTGAPIANVPLKSAAAKKAAEVSAQAKADFEKDNPPDLTDGPEKPDGTFLGDPAPKLGDDFQAPQSELDAQKDRQVVVGAKGEDDDLTVGGIRYLDKAQADAARAKAAKAQSQSDKAAAKAREAGLQ